MFCEYSIAKEKNSTGKDRLCVFIPEPSTPTKHRSILERKCSVVNPEGFIPDPDLATTF